MSGAALPSRLAAVLGTATLACAAVSCGGYGDLPIPLREEALLVVEHADLHPGALGQVQVRFDVADEGDLPSGPLVVVGPPAAIASNVNPTVVNWAVGPCRGGSDGGAAALRLCLAIYVPEGSLPLGMKVGLVVDARAESRRFSAIGDVEVTR